VSASLRHRSKCQSVGEYVVVVLTTILLLSSLKVCLAPPCSYSLSPASASNASAGGAGSFTVAVGSTCSWTATTTNTWLHTTNSGVGNGTVNYTADANANYSVRVGAISVGNQTFIANQAGLPLPLSIGVDNTNLTWVTDTNYPWAVATDVTYDGVDSVASGNIHVANSSSWFQTPVNGPGTLSFWWKVSSDPDPTYGHLDFLIDEVPQNQIQGPVDWNYQLYSIPSGAHSLQWQYVKIDQHYAGADQGWVDQVMYDTNPPIPLQEVLNTCGVTWTSGGNTNPTYWSGEISVSHDGKSAAQSGAIYHSQQSWLQATVNTVTNVAFWWKVSSETNSDYLEFYTNGALARRISGEVNWQSNFFNLPATTNALKWRYAKNGVDIFPKGTDRGWLDQVSFNPAMKAFPYTVGLPVVLPSGAAQVPVSGEVGCPCQVQVSTTLTDWSALTNFTTTNSTMLILDSAASNSPVQFYRALSP
jgi:hypothetical protein